MASETVTARLARIMEVVDDALDSMEAEKNDDLEEMQTALRNALNSLQTAYDTAAAGLIQAADGIIDSRYFTDYDADKRYVYKLGASDGHLIFSLTNEEDYVPEDEEEPAEDENNESMKTEEEPAEI